MAGCNGGTYFKEGTGRLRRLYGAGKISSRTSSMVRRDLETRARPLVLSAMLFLPGFNLAANKVF